MSLVNSATKTSSITTSAGELSIDSASVSYDTDVALNIEIEPGAAAKQYTVYIPVVGLRMLAFTLSQVENDPGEAGPIRLILAGPTLLPPSSFATITASTDPDGAIAGLNLTGGGTGYLNGASGSLPLIFSDPLGIGFGAEGEATITSGVVTSVSLTAGGFAYGAGTVVNPAPPYTLFNLATGNGLNWVIGDPIIFLNGTKCPIAQDVQSLFITNFSESANMLLQLRAGYVSAETE